MSARTHVGGEPNGTRQLDLHRRLDLRIEKRFTVGFGGVSLIVDAFNALNAGSVIRIKDLRLDSPNFGLPAELQTPRQIRLAVKGNF